MGVKITYTPAEVESFRLCPATCDVIDAAAFESRKQFDKPTAERVLRAYGFDTTTTDGQRLVSIVAEACQVQVHHACQSLLDVVRYEGTFPLRLALVKEIERRLPGPHPPSHYEYWLTQKPTKE